MRRWSLFALTLIMAAIAAAFSLANRDAVVLDLIVSRIELPLGVLVIAAVFVGAAIAGLILFGTVVLAQNLKLRALRRELDKLKSQLAKDKAAASADTVAPKPPVV